MAADEDTELRDLVAQTLEANGVLGKIRAQLRSSVFLALEEQDSQQNQPMFVNRSLKSFLATKDGQAVTGLVREFLEHFHLEFTLAVFDPESGYTAGKTTRASLAREYELGDSEKPSRSPLLLDLLRRTQSPPLTRAKYADQVDGNDDYIRIPKELDQKDLAAARKKFDEHDTAKSGHIDQNKLRSLFADMFPHFHKNMLERYVTDEFRAAGKDFSSGVDFDEFAGMYKRLFLQCRSVVSEDVSGLRLHTEQRSPSHSSSQANSQVSHSKKGASAGGDSAVELKNEKNRVVASSAERSQRSSSRQVTNGDYDGSEPEEDPFFDDPLPKSDRSDKMAKPRKSDETSPKSKASRTPTSGQSSLKDLPSLSASSVKPTSTNKVSVTGTGEALTKDSKALDKRMADLGFDVADDYDDDFATNSNLSKGVRSDEDDDESIDEEFSGVEDLLRSGHSGVDDVTTDQTVSINSVTGFDYVEDVAATRP